MSYAICRVQKIGGKKDIAGIQIHNNRERSNSNSNPDIDFNKSIENYSLLDTDGKSYNQVIDKIIDKKYTGTKAIRKDAVRMCEIIFTSDNDFFKNRTTGERNFYFRDCYKFACEQFGADNMVSATVHLDELTPHLHVDFVPLTSDGRLSAKEVVGTKKKLQQLQDDFYAQVGQKYGLERGHRADLENNEVSVKHKTVKQMKVKQKKEIEQLKQEIIELKAEKENLENSIKPIQDIHDELQNIKGFGEVEDLGVFFKKDFRRVMTEDEYDVLITGYRKYIANKEKIRSLDNREQYLNMKIDEFDTYLNTEISRLDVREIQIKEKEKIVENREEKVELLYKKQSNLNEINKKLESENENFKNLVDIKDYCIKSGSKEIKKLSGNLDEAYHDISEIGKALVALQFDSDYEADNLSELGENLVEGIRGRIVKILKNAQRNELAEQTEHFAEVSINIQRETPQVSQDNYMDFDMSFGR